MPSATLADSRLSTPPSSVNESAVGRMSSTSAASFGSSGPGSGCDSVRPARSLSWLATIVTAMLHPVRRHGRFHLRQNERAEAREADQGRHDPGDQHGKQQAVDPEFCRRRHQNDERAGRPADLEAAAAQCGHQKPADDRRIEATVGLDAERYRDGHRERQRQDRDREAGDHVVRKVSAA